ncbi:DJ-1/PfpI family protein [Cadophora sp. DSE1049]|nr:DJ-1/PfpI family protein [Leptodontidium sp. 2 PMI_412]PVH72515.1 DJ-1/PfpI family protein [Cadophora sp. DSE1049]
MDSLQIGIMMESVQLSDIVGVDVFGNLSTEYVKALSELGADFDKFMPLATDMTFHWISTSLELAGMTPTMKIAPTVTYDNAPRNLDILLIGGSAPSFRPAAADKFLKEAMQETKIVMTTCIGALWLASAGGLRGRKATTNRGALSLAKSLYPETEWLDQRWVVDGNIWTSGGAGAGIDMIVTYAKKHFHEAIVQAMVVDSLDFDPLPRGQFYGGSSV